MEARLQPGRGFEPRTQQGMNIFFFIPIIKGGAFYGVNEKEKGLENEKRKSIRFFKKIG